MSDNKMKTSRRVPTDDQREENVGSTQTPKRLVDGEVRNGVLFTWQAGRL